MRSTECPSSCSWNQKMVTQLDCAERVQPQQGVVWPQPKLIRDSNPCFRINPDSDLDVCRIAARMLWMSNLIGVSHLLIVMKIRRWLYEILLNFLTASILRWRGNWKSDPHPGPDHHQKLVSSCGWYAQWNRLITFAVIVNDQLKE